MKHHVICGDNWKVVGWCGDTILQHGDALLARMEILLDGGFGWCGDTILQHGDALLARMEILLDGGFGWCGDIILQHGDALRDMEILLSPLCMMESSFRRLRAAGSRANSE
jgi:hypothetical protein